VPEGEDLQDTIPDSVVKIVVGSLESNAAQPFYPSASGGSTDSGLVHKNSEHFGNVMPDSARSSGAILRPPVSSFLDLCDGLRGNPDS
jgi:hypothetical protein